MTISQECLNEIKKFEGLELESYQDIVGVWTIGHGHTKGVSKGQFCTTDQAESFLKEDVSPCESFVLKVTEGKLNQNQFDSCVDFSFNLGMGAFSRSTLLKLINDLKFT